MSLFSQIHTTDFHMTLTKLFLIFSSYVLIEDAKSLLCKGLRFCIPSKKLKYDDFLAQFALLCKGHYIVWNEIRKSWFSKKNKLRDNCFSSLKLYSFDKVEKNLSEAESIVLKSLIERKDLVLQKADKGNTIAITDRTKYLQGIQSLLLDSSKFMQLPIDEGR